MNNNIIKAAILILVQFSFNIFAQDCNSTLIVNSNDSSAVIYLDSTIAGRGSFNIQISRGKHLVVAKSSSVLWNAQEMKDSVLIEECGLIKKLNFSFKKHIYLNSNPSNAEVYYGDSLIGTTPLYLSSEISPISLKKKDYKSETVSPDNLDGDPFVNMNFIGKQNGRSFLKTNMFKILLGSAIVLGGTAAYYKLRANSHFDDYNLTGSQNALDQTNKYDTISGIAFGALQVNFGVILYYLLTEE